MKNVLLHEVGKMGWTENLFQIALRLMIGFYCSLHISSIDKESELFIYQQMLVEKKKEAFNWGFRIGEVSSLR